MEKESANCTPGESSLVSTGSGAPGTERRSLSSGVVRRSVAGERFRTTLLTSFAAVALILATLGIYGVLAYFVTQRSREIGVRLALGAQPATLLVMVVREGMRPVLAGSAIGLAGAVATTRLMQSLLFGVQAVDPPTYAIVVREKPSSCWGHACSSRKRFWSD